MAKHREASRRGDQGVLSAGSRVVVRAALMSCLRKKENRTACEDLIKIQIIVQITIGISHYYCIMVGI